MRPIIENVSTSLIRVVVDPPEPGAPHVYKYIDSRSITHVVKLVEGTGDEGETVIPIFPIHHII